MKGPFQKRRHPGPSLFLVEHGEKAAATIDVNKDKAAELEWSLKAKGELSSSLWFFGHLQTQRI